MKRFCVWVLAAWLGCAVPAGAAVQDVGVSGFTVTEAVHVGAAPDAVWAVLVAPQRWWSPDHTYSGQAGNLKLDPRAGGCWCETLPGGGSVEHMVVVNAAPGRLLRLSGALGPLQSLPVTGVLTWTIAPAPSGGSDLTLVYGVGGYAPGGFAIIAGQVHEVLAQQIGRLKAVAETGKAPS